MLRRIGAVVALGAGLGVLACQVPSDTQPGPAETHAEIAGLLTGYIKHQIEDKGIPSVAIALVEGNQVVWANAFGVANLETGERATVDTIYRVGSVSKLFTDIGIMQLVERGEIDLDAPVTDYLPDFQPDNPFDTPITLRQLMSHRSGLVREPPVGNYFDATGTTLAETVASLNPTTIVYPPQSQTKYSNAGIATVGYVLEHLSGEPFADYLARSVLEPMGLQDSAFAPSPEIDRRLAQAVMWSYDGRTFPAPTFGLGMSPAGSMYSTVLDMARFMGVVFNGGMGPQEAVIEPETLAAMFEPQFSSKEEPSSYGIGFRIGELDGHATYGHGGAIYGFATTLRFIPDQQLGVVVTASMDVVNSVTNRIADLALEMMLALREGRPLPQTSVSAPIDPEFVKANEGRYVYQDYAIDLIERNGELVGLGRTSSSRIRQRDGQLLIEGRLRNGPSISFPAEGVLRIEGVDFTRVANSIPPPPPSHFEGLMGEYGWDHSVLFIYEKEGYLHALIEWTEIDLLEQISEDVYAFPESSMYHGEQLIFRRDETGRAIDATVASIVFPRREIQGETAETFSIEPVRPVEELRTEALAAEPPVESGDFLESDLVEVTRIEPGVKLDIRYASNNNFMQATFYDEPRAFMQRPAAEAVARAHRALAEHGYGLLIHDAYRPWYVTRMFWDATPEESKLFVADPSQGSRHNRGCAVDITLYDLETGEPIEMTGLYDEFSERSYPDYIAGTSRQRWHRELLRDVMEAEGFTVYEYEWWHFDYSGWEKYRIGNDVFEDLAHQRRLTVLAQPAG